MEKITVLIPTNKLPNTLGDRTLRQFKNIIEELEKICELKIYWVLFQPEKFSESKIEKSKIISFHDFGNALEILDLIKPDLILVSGWIDFSTSLFSFIGKIKKIPVVVAFSLDPYVIKNWTKKIIVKKRMRLLFSNKILEPISTKQSGKLRVFRFVASQYLFLIKTLIKIRIGVLKKLNYIFTFSFALLTRNKPLPSLIYGDLNLCFLQEVKDLLTLEGYKDSDLVFVGNLDFDQIFIKIQKIKLIKSTKSEKTRVLICTTSWHEAGLCPKKIEDDLIVSTINEIQKNSDYTVDIKIHPSNSSKKEYQELLSKNNLKINLYQEEDVLDLLNEYDIMITYGVSSVIDYAALLKIPILFVQYSSKDPEPFAHDENVTTFCKNVNELIPKIKDSRSKKISNTDYDRYIEKYVGRVDGKSSQRAATAISELISKK